MERKKPRAEKSPFKDYVNYYQSAQNATNSRSLVGLQHRDGPDADDKEANLRNY